MQGSLSLKHIYDDALPAISGPVAVSVWQGPLCGLCRLKRENSESVYLNG